MEAIGQDVLLILINKKLLERKFPGTVYGKDREGRPCFQGAFRSTAGLELYTLRLVLPSGSPTVAPRLYVWDPIKLPMRQGGFLNDHPSQHRWHTCPAGPEGRVQICHALSWDPSYAYVEVFLKGILWLEAYRAHLDTGKSICDYFR
ncbi:MAG: hypothetical protein HN742_26410 [Lentisphaerae bacterium]|jgi:hypothetical protein|nr:hypothetical protein [Lentisphaerota bacterium]MBT4817922.1 hypothetical protein [Lentisphaerota bacterium]MBT5605996.1 hypothetical protein [Lentisphaerota bacterium]MBT7058615.1 hypothetical protein [Lentisphaerota bacterium]MBT7845435.1 hypothetical protein [Lentisphaerota bacterium]